MATVVDKEQFKESIKALAKNNPALLREIFQEAKEELIKSDDQWFDQNLKDIFKKYEEVFYGLA